MKGLRIGRRRARVEHASPLELALRPALVDGRWQVPDRFNFTRDVVEALAGDPKRTAVTILGRDEVIEPRTFLEIAEAAAHRAATLAEHGVHPKDRVIVMAETSMHWLEAVLGIWKAGAVAVPVLPSLGTASLEALHASTGASLVVAEPGSESAIGQMSFEPDVLYLEDVPRKRGSVTTTFAPTHDTSSRDLALVFTSPGTGGSSKEIGHTHAAVFATRMQAEHWLDAGRGDVVWCTADADSPLATWFTLAGPWSRGAETVIHQGEFDAQERLEHLYRIGPTILCQSAAEYRALASHEKLERYRPTRLRRLVSTGDVLEPEVVEVFQERWGLAIHDGYGQAETNVFIGDGREAMWKPGSIGRALPGYEIAIVDDQGGELPTGVEGDLAVRGHPPTLFAGYWDAPEDTKRAYRGDLYLTGDVAVLDEDGFYRFVARAEDVITSSGRTFGPNEVEHVLGSHDAITASAVVGIRDLQRGGHFVRAYVVPVPGTSGSEQLEAELRQFLGQVLPEQQVPREIVFVEELPVVRGRLSRAVLRDRPLAGRPLWEMPPTSEPDATPGIAPVGPPPPPASAPAPVPEPAAAEAARVVDTPPEPVVTPEPEPVVVAPTPEPAVVSPAPEPVIPSSQEPVVVAPTPEPAVVTPAPEPVVASSPEPVVVPSVSVEPLVEEPVFVPVPAEPIAPEPGVLPEPEPVMPAPEPVAEAEPAPDDALEPSATEAVAPEPVAAPEPEPVVVVISEPDPTAAEEPIVETAPASEPDRRPETLAEAIPVPEVEQPPEPVRKPELRVVEPKGPQLDVETPPLPTEPPVDATEQAAREPATSRAPEPLPDYIVEPDPSAERPVAPPPPPPEPEPEPDLEPLPDYIVDPNRPAPPPPPEPPARQAAHSPAPAGDSAPGLEDAQSGAAAAGIYFPPVTSFPPPREDDDEPPRPETRKTPRRRTVSEPTKSRSKRSQEEPGDETAEAGWMAGLSNRLSAYSLAKDGEQGDDATGEDATREDEGSSPSEQAS